jgi:hypothetical protein
VEPICERLDRDLSFNTETILKMGNGGNPTSGQSPDGEKSEFQEINHNRYKQISLNVY